MLNNCEDWVDNEVVRTEVNNNVHDGFYGSTEFNFITVVMLKIKKATDEFCCFGHDHSQRDAHFSQLQ